MIPARSFILILLIALLVLTQSVLAGSSSIQATLGDSIPLSGYSPTSPWVYLYLTGPNLPANGVQLNAITQRADEGHFTKLDVDSNDHWSYQWNTKSLGGRLDEGTYTIWVVNGPNDIAHLSQADYSTISVTLGKPAISVDTLAPGGSIDITSAPSGVTVFMNDHYQGQAPLTLSSLAPGSYQLTFTHPGYYNLTSPVTVVANSVSEVNANLVVVQDTPAMTPTITATTVLSTVPATTTAVPTKKAAGLLPATFLAGVVILALLSMCSRR
jgi:hypothetical protein